MRAPAVLCALGAILFSSSRLTSQEPPEKVVVLCDPKASKTCSEDTLEVVFENELGLALDIDGTDSVFQYDTFQEDAFVDTSIMLDTKSAHIQGWSYGVDHDAEYLTLTEVTVNGTVAEKAVKDGFVVASMENIERCAPGVAKCAVSEPVQSYVSAVVLSLFTLSELPLQRNRICRAAYTLEKDPGPNGTVIFITDTLKKRGSPAVQILLTAAGGSVVPKNLVDGWVRRSGDFLVEECGNAKDDDEDGKVDCDDRDCSGSPDCRPAPEDCDNGKDDDRDGRFDCDDAECFQLPPCVPLVEICDNGTDDDEDGRVGCEDEGCEFFVKCRRENCGNEFDDNADGAVDCDDKQCENAVLCVPEICDNGIDDNRNAMTDCYDPDCESFPACEPKAEICDNGMDEDFDGKIDCSDRDCKDVSGCEPRPEVCDNGQDDDQDGRTDCRDSDCTPTEACAPKPEICDNCFDDDRDGDMDCLDEECLTHSFCAPKPEICDNFIDDDEDGEADADDSDCWLPSPLPLGVCESYALYFGPAAVPDDHEIEADGLAISLRNLSPVLSFRLQVARKEEGDLAIYELTADALEPSVEDPGIRVLNDYRTFQEPRAGNRAIGNAGDTIAGIERGAAIERFEAVDFLSFDIEPRVRQGTCLAVQYIVDLNLKSPRGAIFPTPSGAPCPVNELLRIRMAPKPPPSFRRGDLDGVEGLGVTDALIILNSMIFGIEPAFDCEDVLDVDDDGRVNITDPIVILRYQFQGGPAPAEPFESCSEDPTPVDLLAACVDSNCR